MTVIVVFSTPRNKVDIHKRTSRNLSSRPFNSTGQSLLVTRGKFSSAHS